jgi:hypothetical protein
MNRWLIPGLIALLMLAEILLAAGAAPVTSPGELW